YRFGFFKKNINGVFYDNIKAYTDRMSGITEINTLKSFNNFNKICCDLYLDLFKEVDETVKTENIIIVPDEEIAFISFDALQPEFKRQKIINYSAPDYLIYKYCFSYAYSSPLLFGRSKRKFDTFVYAFAPVYNDSINNPLRQNFGNLKQTQNEIKSVLGYFNGKAYTGSSALEDSLKTVFGKCGIIHIAGHASYEDTEREFSFLAFSDKPGISHEDGLLFAYEIESLNICSPMVVLSACNTGRGRLYSGEGVYSLARSFLTAGVLSVVYSLWNVNDNSAYEIMAKFYEYLSKGEMKNKALRAAKLNYLNTATPMAADPRYWSGYVISGDISPVVKSYGIKIVQIIAGIIFVFSVFVLLYALKSYDKNNKS
ncbi:MAG: CHAT domain-containing protein, partial [Chlorobi bacterium]|nr:CHAT domain-containing protein [Chlorobiota bacterium]